MPSLYLRQSPCISTNQRLIKSSLRVFIELNLLPSPQHHSASLRSGGGAVNSNLLITWSVVTAPPNLGLSRNPTLSHLVSINTMCSEGTLIKYKRHSNHSGWILVPGTWDKEQIYFFIMPCQIHSLAAHSKCSINPNVCPLS